MNQLLSKIPLPFKIISVTIGFMLAFVGVALYADMQIHDNQTGLNTNAPASTETANLSFSDKVNHAVLRWDTGHYKSIIENGYQEANAAFFPLYPLVVSGIKLLGVSTNAALLAVSWLFTIAAILVLFYWIRFELKQRKVKLSPWITLGIVAVFPTSFYLVAGYTESLFLFLIISSIYAYRTKHYLLAGLFIALSTATRVPGGALAFFFLFDYLLAKKWGDWKKLIPVVMAPIGLVAYMIYMYHAFGNPFQFIDAQHSWGRLNGNPIENLISSFTPIYFWFLPLLAYGLWLIKKYLGWPWLLYSLVFIAIPLVSGRLDSINRYMLGLPPLFLALTLHSLVAPKWLKLLYIVSSALLLAWGVIFFTNNYWVG